MADRNDIKERLKRKLDAKIPKVVQARQLDEAADKIINRGSADREFLRGVGAEVFGDREILANSDIDDINDTLSQLDE